MKKKKITRVAVGCESHFELAVSRVAGGREGEIERFGGLSRV